MIKKIILSYVMFLSLIMWLRFPIVNAQIQESCIEPNRMINTVKKITFGNEFEYIVKFRCYPEAQGYDCQLNRTIYKRKAEVIGEMFYNGKVDKMFPKKILSNYLSVIFTYDKQQFVTIENPKIDIEKSKGNYEKDKWQTMCSQEILESDSECIVSQICMFHKNPKMSRHLKYIDNSHADLICDMYGNISLDSKAI